MANSTYGNKIFNWSLLSVSACLLASCATSRTEQKVPIVVLSDPPGARVEANGQFLGTTPLRTEIHRYKNPQTDAWYGITINAFPTQPGQCSQEKKFAENAPLATHMYFDMSLCPVAPSKPRSAN